MKISCFSIALSWFRGKIDYVGCIFQVKTLSINCHLIIWIFQLALLFSLIGLRSKIRLVKKIKRHLFQTINKGFSLKASNTMLTTNNLKTGQNKLCLRYVFRELEAFWENYSQSPSQLRARQNIA